MGAWTQLYVYKDKGATGSALAYAILALKKELSYCGYTGGMDLSLPYFGAEMLKSVKIFQGVSKLVVDGEVGPLTSAKLFCKRCNYNQTLLKIPNSYVAKLLRLESAFDPGAVGVSDPNDHGLAQINAVANPQVTLSQAFDPSYAIPYLADSIENVFQNLKDWDAAIAAWNIGAGTAQAWLEAGKPATGGPSWFPNGYERATQYVALVNGEAAC